MGINMKSLQRVFDALLGIHEALGLPHLVCLLAIEARAGLSVNELASATRYPQQSVSRYIALLLGRYENAVGPSIVEPLVEQSISATDPRRRALTLTPTGHALVQNFMGTIFVEGNS